MDAIRVFLRLLEVTRTSFERDLREGAFRYFGNHYFTLLWYVDLSAQAAKFKVEARLSRNTASTVASPAGRKTG